MKFRYSSLPLLCVSHKEVYLNINSLKVVLLLFTHILTSSAIMAISAELLVRICALLAIFDEFQTYNKNKSYKFQIFMH